MPRLSSRDQCDGQRVRRRRSNPRQGVVVGVFEGLGRDRASRGSLSSRTTSCRRDASSTLMRKLSVRKPRSMNGTAEMPYTGAPTVRGDFELARVGLRDASRHDHLATRDRQRVHHRVRSRFPEPVAHLVVEGLELADLVDVRVVAQPVEQLWPVRLEVDRVELVALDVTRACSAPPSTGWTIVASHPSQVPARGASGPRFARVSASPSGSVNRSSPYPSVCTTLIAREVIEHRRSRSG